MNLRGMKFEIDLISIGPDDVVFSCRIRAGDTLAYLLENRRAAETTEGETCV